VLEKDPVYVGRHHNQPHPWTTRTVCSTRRPPLLLSPRMSSTSGMNPARRFIERPACPHLLQTASSARLSAVSLEALFNAGACSNRRPACCPYAAAKAPGEARNLPPWTRNQFREAAGSRSSRPYTESCGACPARDLRHWAASGIKGTGPDVPRFFNAVANSPWDHPQVVSGRRSRPYQNLPYPPQGPGMCGTPAAAIRAAGRLVNPDWTRAMHIRRLGTRIRRPWTVTSTIPGRRLST